MSDSLSRHEMYDGMEVTVICAQKPQFNGDWLIVKVNPKNVKLINSKGELLNASPSFIYRRGSSVSAPLFAPIKRAVMPDVVLGSLVEFPRNAMGKMPTGPDNVYVVIAIRRDMFNVALVGGDGNRYWHVRENNYQHVHVMDRDDIHFS